MLLRSFTKHVRDQNWLTVWLDFFIVPWAEQVTEIRIILEKDFEED